LSAAKSEARVGGATQYQQAMAGKPAVLDLKTERACPSRARSARLTTVSYRQAQGFHTEAFMPSD